MSTGAIVVNNGPFPSGVARNSAAGQEGRVGEELSEKEAVRRAQQRDYYFSASVAFFQIADRLGDFTQPVLPGMARVPGQWRAEL